MLPNSFPYHAWHEDRENLSHAESGRNLAERSSCARARRYGEFWGVNSGEGGGPVAGSQLPLRADRRSRAGRGAGALSAPPRSLTVAALPASRNYLFPLPSAAAADPQELVDTVTI